ncbi:MAG: hypothetical protein CMJ30_06290 [Phycisphaerae bacterium]|nr:hypothetical protein [Phycisphaerae bacterium]
MDPTGHPVLGHLGGLKAIRGVLTKSLSIGQWLKITRGDRDREAARSAHGEQCHWRVTHSQKSAVQTDELEPNSKPKERSRQEVGVAECTGSSQAGLAPAPPYGTSQDCRGQSDGAPRAPVGFFHAVPHAGCG